MIMVALQTPMGAHTFGERLREARRAAGFNIHDFADLIGVDFTYVSKIETGVMAPPSEDTLVRIAETGVLPRGELLWRASLGTSSIADELASGEQAVVLPSGQTAWVDYAVAGVVAALNTIPNLRTSSCCSGHERMRASILFRAADGDNDALMHSPVVRALAWSRDEQDEHLTCRSVIRRLHGTTGTTGRDDDFELAFWGCGSDGDERYRTYCDARQAIIELCEQFGR